jgi:hypothetical protein
MNQLPLPENIQKYFEITLLGKPFAFIDKNGKIVRGYEFEGNKYYESK